MSPVLEAIFGNRSAVQTLLFLEAYDSGYASRIAKTFGVSVMAIQRQLRRLEAEGVLVSRTVGKTRVFEFNTRNPTVRNLREFLKAELALLPETEVKEYFRQRQRPRRSGKQMA
jgi:predicted ArsR family transcriptional regulator